MTRRRHSTARGASGGLARVYHGTTRAHYPRIAKQGLRPAPGRDIAYVTTSFREAEQYALVWAMHQQEFHDDQDGHGVVFSMAVPRSALSVDPDDWGEPNQYVVKGGVGLRWFRRSEFFEYDFSRWPDLVEQVRQRIGPGGYACRAGCPRTITPEKQNMFHALKAQATTHALISTIHGLEHWWRVARAGLELSRQTPDADRIVVFLFAMLHDSQRHNDGHDPDHGRRAAAVAGHPIDTLDDDRRELLAEACAGHADGGTTSDPTIGACWDADRLDLWRLGRRPDPALLSTSAARDSDMIEWARALQDRPVGGWPELMREMFPEHMRAR